MVRATSILYKERVSDLKLKLQRSPGKLARKKYTHEMLEMDKNIEQFQTELQKLTDVDFIFGKILKDSKRNTK